MWRFVSLGVKAGLAGGFIYYTVEEGVWGNSEDTAKLYRKAYKKTAPYIKDYVKEVPIEIPDIPKLENVSQMSQHYWNCGVKKTFTFLRDLPHQTAEWSKSSFSYIQHQLSQTDQPHKE